MNEDKLKKVASKEVAEIQKYEMEMAQLQQALAENPQFTRFLAVQKELNHRTNEFLADMKQKMLNAGVKSVKGDWGWVTLAEVRSYKVADETELPKKYFKRMPDMDLIKNTAKLTGKIPKGVDEVVSFRLTKKFKLPEEDS